MSEGQGRKRILLGQLASNGDCLYATTIARQIKVDYPGCHLTWAISSGCRSVLEGNPDVDSIWEISDYSGPNDHTGWRRFKAEALKRKKRGDFDEVFLTQISPDNLHFWVGSVRSSIFRAYPHPVTVDEAPVLRLSPEEVERVRLFAASHYLEQKAGVIIFECAPRSQQSPVNPQFALEIAHKVVASHPDVAIILSSATSFSSDNENIIDGSVLSLRENAELTKYGTLFIGASSGITWIATSDWAKPLPMIQLVRPDVELSNSLVYDFKKRGLDTSSIIEMNSYGAKDVVACVDTILKNDFNAARKFNQVTPLKFELYKNVQHFLVIRGRFRESLRYIGRSRKEHGFHIQFLTTLILVYIECFFLLPFKAVTKLKSRLGF